METLLTHKHVFSHSDMDICEYTQTKKYIKAILELNSVEYDIWDLSLSINLGMWNRDPSNVNRSQHSERCNVNFKIAPLRLLWSRLLCICWPVFTSLWVCMYIYIHRPTLLGTEIWCCATLSQFSTIWQAWDLAHCKGHQRQEEGDRERLVEFTLCSVCVSVWDCVSEGVIE